MCITLTPQMASVLNKLLNLPLPMQETPQGYVLPEENGVLSLEKISTFIVRTTGFILSYEQQQWIWTKTKGWLPAVVWAAESINREHPPRHWDPGAITWDLQVKSSTYFHSLISEKLSYQDREILFTLALLPSPITHDMLYTLWGEHNHPEILAKKLHPSSLLTRTSPTTWELHPLFRGYLRSALSESLPHYAELCQKMAFLYIENHLPLAAEEVLTLIAPADSPRLAPLFFSLGKAFVKNGPKEKALTCFQRASLGFGELNDAQGITSSLNAMGTLYLELGHREEAEALFHQIKQELPPEQWPETFIPFYLSQTLPKLSIYCLGNFLLYRGDEPLDWCKWQRRKALAILQYLALQPAYRSTKEQLLELFWPEESPDKAGNSYHVTIHTLRRGLSAGLREEVPYLRVERGAVCLNSDTIAFIDAVEFQRLYQEGRLIPSHNPNQRIPLLQEAKKLYRGNLLDGNLYDEWVFPYRDSLFNDYLDILALLASDALRRKNWEEGLKLWKKVLRLDPTHETAAREVMSLLLRLERRTEALGIYKRLVFHLKQDLDTAPESQTEALFKKLRM